LIFFYLGGEESKLKRSTMVWKVVTNTRIFVTFMGVVFAFGNSHEEGRSFDF